MQQSIMMLFPTQRTTKKQNPQKWEKEVEGDQGIMVRGFWWCQSSHRKHKEVNKLETFTAFAWVIFYAHFGGEWVPGEPELLIQPSGGHPSLRATLPALWWNQHAQSGDLHWTGRMLLQAAGQGEPLARVWLIWRQIKLFKKFRVWGTWGLPYI